ncbi:PAS domain-containing sensor histidine kinase [Desulfobulbus sp.]|uniref:PAS domain-containing sensor histidine kinase n=1 Tax=Desulfobulbus sp. TaxID=895 RepID=UPI0027BA96A3|nr:PAS domain-containing sensor histidine kinase [Desulfobulbus sp.]
MTKNKKKHLDDLRRRADALLSLTPNSSGMAPTDDVNQIVHELQVQQIELELQNEELRSTQSALEESRAKYMQLYHHAPVGYVVLDYSGIIIQVNATFAMMVNRDRPQMLGKPFHEFLLSEDRSIFLARAKAFFKNPVDKYLELRIGNATTSTRYVSLRATPGHRPEEGQSPHLEELLLTVTDISDRKRAEEALRASEQFARSTVDALAAHIAILDATGHIVAVNRAWRDFGRANQAEPAAVSEGVNYLAVCRAVQGHEAETAGVFAAGILAVLKGERDTFSHEYACHGPMANRWFIGRVSRFSDGEVVRIVVAHENITERRQLENKNLLLQRQVSQLEKEESLGRMAGAIAHHFNNLLTAVIGNIEMALEDVPRGQGLSRMLTAALSGAKRAAEISGKMLTYLGVNSTKKEQLDLSVICRQSLPLLQMITPSGGTMHADFPSSGPVVFADLSQIQVLLTNLVHNGWEACEGKDGALHLAIKTVDAADIVGQHRFPFGWQPQTEKYGCLLVQDNGCGIKNEDLSKIFEPFFSSKFTGRGMGLALVLGILKAHNSCATVESRPGGGTTFQVYFPVQG